MVPNFQSWHEETHLVLFLLRRRQQIERPQGTLQIFIRHVGLRSDTEREGGRAAGQLGVARILRRTKAGGGQPASSSRAQCIMSTFYGQGARCPMFNGRHTPTLVGRRGMSLFLISHMMGREYKLRVERYAVRDYFLVRTT